MPGWVIFLIVYGAINLLVGIAALVKVTLDWFADYLTWLFPVPGSIYLLCDGYIERPAMITLQVIATIIFLPYTILWMVIGFLFTLFIFFMGADGYD